MCMQYVHVHVMCMQRAVCACAHDARLLKRHHQRGERGLGAAEEEVLQPASVLELAAAVTAEGGQRVTLCEGGMWQAATQSERPPRESFGDGPWGS